jgi:steroid delta-isomerase-like uncharacterized protein
MSTQTNKQLIRDLIDQVWNDGNLDRIDDFISSDYVMHDPVSGDVHGVEGFREFVSTYRNAFPDLRLEVKDQIAEGDRVVTRWLSPGTHQGELMGIAPTGRQTMTPGIVIDRLADGKIRETWSMWDALGLMQELGVVPDLEEMA